MHERHSGSARSMCVLLHVACAQHVKATYDGKKSTKLKTQPIKTIITNLFSQPAREGGGRGGLMNGELYCDGK